MKKRDIRLAVLGDPVAHSLSPAMHDAALRHCGLAGSYERIHTRAEELTRVVARLRSDGYAGFNITIPHKQRIVPLLNRIDESAQRIGAVNTVVATYSKGVECSTFNVQRSGPAAGDTLSFSKRGTAMGSDDGEPLLTGYNTDASGLARIVTSLTLDGARRALVLGAGGAARAAVDTLLNLDWEVTVANRTPGRARNAFGTRAHVVALEPELDLGDFSLVINATSAGMNAPDESPLHASVALRRHLTVIDLVYAPLDTRLLRDAQAAGCRVVDGLELLAAQAADSFELWTGRRLPDSFFRRAAEEALSQGAVRRREDGGDGHESTRWNGHVGSASGSFSNDPYDSSNTGGSFSNDPYDSSNTGGSFSNHPYDAGNAGGSFSNHPYDRSDRSATQ